MSHLFLERLIILHNIIWINPKLKNLFFLFNFGIEKFIYNFMVINSFPGKLILYFHKFMIFIMNKVFKAVAAKFVVVTTRTFIKWSGYLFWALPTFDCMQWWLFLIIYLRGSFGLKRLLLSLIFDIFSRVFIFI